jgi:uncharacterized radical SAM superfamily Fe-S cluster-containing enzyme
MEIIKKDARSICPVCIKEIDASIISKREGVFIKKACPEHGVFIIRVEKDVELYKAFLNRTEHDDRINATKFTIPITHKCNLSCNYCYYPNRHAEELSTKQIKRMIKEFSGDFIVLSGGEPTIRKDLFELIGYARRLNKHVTLSTNGLKLSEKKIVKKRKNLGLSLVHFSLNGVSNAILKRMHNKDNQLRYKLKALDNLKRYNIPTMISFLIQKGVNDHQVRKVWKLCIENHSFINSLRLRIPSPAGKYEKEETYYLSEVLSMVCDMMKIRYPEVILEINREKKNKKLCNINLSFLIYKKMDITKTLSWDIYHIKKKSSWFVKTSWFVEKFLGKEKGLFFYDSESRLKLIYKMGFLKFIKYLFRRIFLGGKIIRMEISIRCWPNKFDMDMDANKMCPSVTLNEKNEIMPFCYSHIYNESIKNK